MGFRRTRPRKVPIKRDQKEADNFKENFKVLLDMLDVWFYDETGIEGDAAPRLVWSLKGRRKTCYYNGSHIRESVMGAANPKTGELETLIMPYVDTQIFQQFLDYFNERLAGRHVVMVLDNASWHKTASLTWGTVIPVYLPPYCPDLNPIEVLWKVLKDRAYDLMPPKNNEELQDRIQTVIRQFLANPNEVKSICKPGY